MPTGGMWCGRLSQIGQTDWFTFPVRGNRIFTVVTAGHRRNRRALKLQGHAHHRRVGRLRHRRRNTRRRRARPQWPRHRRNLAARRHERRRHRPHRYRRPARRRPTRLCLRTAGCSTRTRFRPRTCPLPAVPSPFRASGFRLADTVLVGGQPALVTSISPNQITAIAPPAASGVTGSVDVEVDDLPTLYAAAIIPGGISYDSGTGDALTLVTAPSNTVPIGVPLPFTVTALTPALTPAGGVTVIYTVTAGTATLDCGLTICCGDDHRRWPRHHERHRERRHVVHHHRLAYQRLERPGAIRRRNCPRGFLSHAAACARRRQPLSPGPCRLSSFPAALHSPASRSRGKLRPAAASLRKTPLPRSPTPRASPQRPSPLARSPRARSSASTPASTEPANASPFRLTERAPSTHCSSRSSEPPRPSLPRARPARSLSASSTWTAIPMAGGTVALYQALYAWSPPCSPHIVCTQGALLATQSATATSAIDGSVTFLPVSLPGVATNLLGLAASGNTATVNIAIQQHP